MFYSQKIWAIGAMMFGIAALGSLGVSVWITTEALDSEDTENATNDTAAKQIEDSIEVRPPSVNPTTTPTPISAPTTDSKQSDPYTISYDGPTYILFGPSSMLREHGSGYFMRAVNSKDMAERETITFDLEENYYPEPGSENGIYNTNSAQVDDKGHVYLQSSNSDVFVRSQENSSWRISQGLESRATKVLVEVSGHPIAHWVVSPDGTNIVYDVIDSHDNYDHEFYRYDIEKGTNTRIVMNTPYDADYQPMDGSFNASFIGIVGDELHGYYVPKLSDVGYFYRVNIKNGVFTQTALRNKNDQNAISAASSKAAWWDGGPFSLLRLKLASLDLTKGTSYTEKELLTAYSDNSNVEWNPAGTAFFFHRNDANGAKKIYVYDLATNQEKTTNLSSTSPHAYEWLNNTEFLFTYGVENKIGVYNTSTGENRLFNFEDFTPYGIEYFAE